SWVTSGEVFGAVFDVVREDITMGGGEEVIATVVDPEGGSSSDRRSYIYCDQDIEPAHQYRYRIVGRFEMWVDGELREFNVPTGDIYEISLIPRGGDLVSYLLPNPTSRGTSITVDVQKSYYDPAGGQEETAASATMQSPLLVEILTPVDIGVYNVKGQRIATVYNGKMFGATKTFPWNGLDNYGRPVAPGVYFMRVAAGGRVSTKKVVVVR
ncbi:MAG: T9SS type A sorting domain-containing protein, partial [bacterium]